MVFCTDILLITATVNSTEHCGQPVSEEIKPSELQPTVARLVAEFGVLGSLQPDQPQPCLGKA
jgi:hypothetical protein